MKSPEFIEKMKQAPVAVLTVMPNGPISIGRPLAQWFVFLIVVGIFVAYIASRTLPVGASYRHLFQIVGATMFIAYSLGLLNGKSASRPSSIFVANPSLSVTSPISRFGSRRLWRRSFGGPQGQS